MTDLITKLEQMKKDYEDDTLVSMSEGAGNFHIARVIQEIIDLIKSGQWTLPPSSASSATKA